VEWTGAGGIKLDEWSHRDKVGHFFNQHKIGQASQDKTPKKRPSTASPAPSAMRPATKFKNDSLNRAVQNDPHVGAMHDNLTAIMKRYPGGKSPTPSTRNLPQSMSTSAGHFGPGRTPSKNQQLAPVRQSPAKMYSEHSSQLGGKKASRPPPVIRPASAAN